MNYTLNQLRIFLKIAQLQSVTKAADELFLSQPAVSIQLKNFQDQFDLPLTEVIGRRLYVTDFGNEVALAAEKILNEVEALNYKKHEHKGNLSGRIRFSIVSTGKYIMPYFLTDFLKQHPGIVLQMEVTNKAKVIDTLERNEVDFAFVSVLPEKIKVETISLMPNKLFLVANPQFYKSKSNKNIKNLSNENFIYREVGSATRLAMEQFVLGNNLPVSKKIELTSNEAVKQAILAGLGISIMPLIGLKNELLNGELKIVDLKGLPLLTNWNIIWLEGKKFSPIAEAYTQFLQAEKTRIINNYFKWYDNF